MGYSWFNIIHDIPNKYDKFSTEAKQKYQIINFIPLIVYAFVQAAQMVSSSVVVMLIAIVYLYLATDLTNLTQASFLKIKTI